MKALYNFPKAAAFGKMLAKSKIYKHATPTSKVKNLFVAQVEKITWAYKLSPATINLPASDDVQEIQVFNVALRTGTLSSEVLQIIDKAIPSPILFMLSYKRKCRYVAAYKRPSDADKGKWVVSNYFQGNWLSDSAKRAELPIVLNMAALYHFFLKAVIPLPFRKCETLDTLAQRVDQLRIKERESGKLESQIKKEKQFNRRVDLNRTLNDLKQEVESLKD